MTCRSAGSGCIWRGWEVAGIRPVQSGSPVAVTQATNLNAFAGFGIQRPNRIGDPTLPADQRTHGALVQYQRLHAGAAVHAR